MGITPRDIVQLLIKRGVFATLNQPIGEKMAIEMATETETFVRSVLLEDRPLKITGMAFQAPTLLPWRTTIDNVLFPREVQGTLDDEARAHANELIAMRSCKIDGAILVVLFVH